MKKTIFVSYILALLFPVLTLVSLFLVMAILAIHRLNSKLLDSISDLEMEHLIYTSKASLRMVGYLFVSVFLMLMQESMKSDLKAGIITLAMAISLFGIIKFYWALFGGIYMALKKMRPYSLLTAYKKSKECQDGEIINVIGRGY